MRTMLNHIFVFLLVIFSFFLFDAKFLNKTVVNYAVYGYLLSAVLLALPYVRPARSGFILPVQLISLSIFISIFMANWTWNQSLFDTFLETVPYTTWMAFFFLLHIKISSSVLEKIIVFYGILYSVLYFYQLANSSTVLFGKSILGEGEEFITNRGITRIIFPGAGIFILAVFISINKLTTGATNKWFWLAFSFMGIVIPILQVTRQFIMGVLLVYLYHFLKGQNIIRKGLVLVIFAFSILVVTSLDNDILKGLSEASEDDYKEGGDYIRVLAGQYFLLDFSPDIINRVLGNGAPYWGISPYGVFIENLEETEGYHLSDVGIIGMYAMFGILSVVGFILIWIKSFRYSLPKEFQYLKYYLWYLLFTSFTWFTVYHYHYIISTVFVLYLFQTIYYKKHEQSVSN